jgi:hypothetical protein
MTENDQSHTESDDAARNRWVDEVQGALDRTGDAIRSAWDATRESRMSALESAKQAASELADVLDKGIAAAKERWAAATDQESAPPAATVADEAASEDLSDPTRGDDAPPLA